MNLSFILSSLVGLIAAAAAQNITTPPAPSLTYLYSLNCTLGEAIAIGNGPKGNRVAIPITGGTFAGPRIKGTFPASHTSHPSSLTFIHISFDHVLLSKLTRIFSALGKVLNLGADWGLTDSKGTFSADTRYNLQTDDGANIFIQTSGPAQKDGNLHLRLLFETGSEKYYWLNDLVAVGILKAGNGWVAIDAWQLVSPVKT